MEPCGKSLVCARMSFASVQISRAFILSQTAMLVSRLIALLVSGPESNTLLNVQRNRCALSFLFSLEPHWCCCGSAVRGQTIRVCLCILQFPAFHSPLPWSNKRNSLEGLSVWLLPEGEKQIQLFLTTHFFHNGHWSQFFPHHDHKELPTVLLFNSLCHHRIGRRVTMICVI